LVKVPSLEQILCRGRFRHPGSYRRIPSLSIVCTRTLLSRVRELSLEGFIGKRAGSKYDLKRSGAWIKIKLYQQGSFVIGGHTQPAGERKHMGALLVGVYENGKLKFAGRVGTGFSEKLLKKPVEAWIKG
jgi:ATP-dependent DNA ligase